MGLGTRELGTHNMVGTRELGARSMELGTPAPSTDLGTRSTELGTPSMELGLTGEGRGFVFACLSCPVVLPHVSECHFVCQ